MTIQQQLDALAARVAALENPLPAPFRAEEFGISATAPGYDPTGEGSAYQPAAEPAPGSDAEHPPLGYRLAKVAEKREPGYVFWDGEGWIEGESTLFGSPIDPWHSSPCANPITANEGDSRAAESVAIPVGWIKSMRQMLTSPQVWRPLMAAGKCVGAIEPDPSIPWGEGYEAILPSEATEGDEYLGASGMWWKSGGGGCHPTDPKRFAWRRRIPATTPTEPARDLSDKIAESVVQDLQQACYDRDELRATVERLTAELDATKRLLAESLVERDRLKNLHDARKVRIDGFRDVLREHLGDLV